MNVILRARLREYSPTILHCKFSISSVYEFISMSIPLHLIPRREMRVNQDAFSPAVLKTVLVETHGAICRIYGHLNDTAEVVVLPGNTRDVICLQRTRGSYVACCNQGVGFSDFSAIEVYHPPLTRQCSSTPYPGLERIALLQMLM